MRAGYWIAIAGVLVAGGGTAATIQASRSGSFLAPLGWTSIALFGASGVLALVGLVAAYSDRSESPIGGNTIQGLRTKGAKSSINISIGTPVAEPMLQEIQERTLAAAEARFAELGDEVERRAVIRVESILNAVMEQLRDHPEQLDRPELPQAMGDAIADALTRRDPRVSESEVIEGVVETALAGRKPVQRVKKAVLVAIGVVTAGTITAAAFALASRGSTAVGLDREALAGIITINYPHTWRERAASPQLLLPQAISLAPGEGGRGHVLAGVTTGSPPTFLPSAFRQRLVGGPVRPAYVQVGPHAALRYEQVRQRGFSESLTLYVLPTRKHVAIIGCSNEVPSRVCSAIVGRLELAEAPLDSRPHKPFAKKLSGILAPSARRQNAETAALRASRTSREQASHAQRLAQEHSRVAAQVDALKCPSIAERACDQLTAALQAKGRAYRQLGTGAAKRDPRAYHAAIAATQRADRLLAAAHTTLTNLGYQIAVVRVTTATAKNRGQR